MANEAQYTRNDKGAAPLRKRAEVLYNETKQWRQRWQDVKTYISPNRGRFLDSSAQSSYEGTPEDLEILNNMAMGASRTLRSGLMSGLTSPSTPWFSLVMDEWNYVNDHQLAAWLENLRLSISRIMAHSNFYLSMENLYAELVDFGVAAMLIEEDDETVIRCVPLSIGEFQLSCNSKGVPTTLYRRFYLTADQIVEKFGRKALPVTMNEAYQFQEPTKFLVIHAIEPRSTRKLSRNLPEDMEYVSAYFLNSNYDDEEDFLSYKGYRTIPFVAPRWSVIGNEAYGISPGMEALNDVRMLQRETELFYEGFEKAVDPALNGPASMQRTGADNNPGALNVVENQGEHLAPVHVPNIDFNGHLMVKENIENAIEEPFYVKLFSSALNTTKRQTAEEVAERRAEKMALISPALERAQNECLAPQIDRIIDIMGSYGLIKDVPESLEGGLPSIEYNGLLSLAQTAASTRPLEQWLQFVSGIAEFNPDVLDHLNFDQIAVGYAQKTHVPPDFVRSDEEVKQMRKQRAQQQQQEQQAMQAQTNQANAGAVQSLAGAAQSGASAAQMMNEMNVGGGKEAAMAQMLGG